MQCLMYHTYMAQRVKLTFDEMYCCMRNKIVEEGTIGEVAPMMSISKCGEGTLSGKQ